MQLGETVLMVYALRTFGWVGAALRRPKPSQNVCLRSGACCGGVAEWLKAHSAPKARVPSLKDRVRLGVRCGGVAEWLKAHAWKVCMRETVSRVRIPPPPPTPCSAASKAIHRKDQKAQISGPLIFILSGAVHLNTLAFVPVREIW